MRSLRVRFTQDFRDAIDAPHPKVGKPSGRKRPDIGACIEQYRRLCEEKDQTAVTEASRKALADRHYLLVTRAAEVAGERLLYDLEAELIGTFERFLDNPAKKVLHRSEAAFDRLISVVEKGDQASAELDYSCKTAVSVRPATL